MGRKRIFLVFLIFIAIILGLAAKVGSCDSYSGSLRAFRPIEEKLIFSTVTPKSEPYPGNSPEFEPYPIVWQMLAQVDGKRALADLRRLTGEEPICVNTGCYTIINRLTGSQGLDWVQSYMIDLLVNLGYSVEISNWSRSSYADQNIIAWKTGKIYPEEEVYFVSHVDGIAKGVDVTPAADDNASSVVNGLELARIFSNYEFERTLALFFSSGEEQGYIGVDEYLEQLTDEELGRIKFAVNRDMTGYDGNGDRVMELFHGNHSPSILLAQSMGEMVTDYHLELVPLPVVGCP